MCNGPPRSLRRGEDRGRCASTEGIGRSSGRTGFDCTGSSEGVTPAGSGLSGDTWSPGPATYLPRGTPLPAFRVDFAIGCFRHKFTKSSSPAYHTVWGVDDRLTSEKMLGHIPIQMLLPSLIHSATWSSSCSDTPDLFLGINHLGSYTR